MKKFILITSTLAIFLLLSFSLPIVSSNESNFTDLNIEAFDDPPQQIGMHCTTGCVYSGEIDCCVRCDDCHLMIQFAEDGDNGTCYGE
ncbi:MAG: hypothetical protein ACP5E3_06575 [Bacteroidales bacterium]